MKQGLKKAMIVFLTAVMSLTSLVGAAPGTVYVAEAATVTQADIDGAKAALTAAQKKQKEMQAQYNLGSLGFINWMLKKSNLTEKQIYDLKQAKTVLEEAMEESFARWGGDIIGLPASRGDKVVAAGDEKDAISLRNTARIFDMLREVNQLREQDDNYVGGMKREPACTNFYFMAVAQSGADRGAGLRRHSLLQVSCENLMFGTASPSIWYSEKGAFDKFRNQLGLRKLTSEADLQAVQEAADTAGYETGHYTNLFWGIDQLMGIGITSYGTTGCYNASKRSNYSDKYASYTIDEMETLYKKYAAVADMAQYDTAVDKARTALNNLLDQSQQKCASHTFVKNKVVAPTCTKKGYTEYSCSVCGYVKRSAEVAALGHDLKDGWCSRCSYTEPIRITELVREMGANRSWGYSPGQTIELEERTEAYTEKLSFYYAPYGTEDDRIYGVSSNSAVATYESTSNDEGYLHIHGPGKAVLKFYSAANPDVITEFPIEVAHILKTVKGYAPTCTKSGLSDRITCTLCGKVIQKQETIPALGHVLFIHEGYPATCTEEGLTDGAWCTVCEKMIREQEVIPALGHRVVIDPAVEPTGEEFGMTAGSHCSRCGRVLKEQQFIAKKEFSEIAPKVTKTVSAEARTVKLSWKPISGAVRYQVQGSTDGKTYKLVKTVTGTSYTAAVTRSGKYYFKVTAVNAEGQKSEAGKVSGKLLFTDISKIKRAQKGLTLTWQKADGATHYQVLRGTSAAVSGMKVIKTVTGTTCTDKTAVSGTKYYYRIRPVVKKDGAVTFTGTASAAASLRAVNAPASVSRSRTATGIKVTWKAAENVSGYVVQRKAGTGSWKTVKTISSGSTVTFTDSGLISGKQYQYRVKSFCTVNGSKLYSVYCTGTGLKALNAPKEVKAENAASGIRVTWKTVKNASGYVVQRKAGTGSWKTVKTTEATSYTDKNLVQGKKYQYRVYAYLNKTSDRSIASGTEIAYRLAKPVITALTSGASGKLTVKWSRAEGTSGYQIRYSLKSDFTGAKTVANTGKAANAVTSVKNLSGGSRYYVQLRSYKTVDQVKYYSAWSTAKNVTVKK